MPYKNNEVLPETVIHVLPKHAQNIKIQVQEEVKLPKKRLPLKLYGQL